jgi:hypothetical protein
MSELLARVRDYFVEVGQPTTATPTPLRRAGSTAPSSLGLVAPPRIATAAGAALALSLARVHSSPCALLCHWGPAPGGAPAARSAARAASALRSRDLAATAVGRLVRVVLDDEPHPASALARAAAVVPGPSVLAVGRPRNKDIDRALAAQDAIAWLPPDEPTESLIAVVAGSLRALGRPVLECTAPSALARRLALAGIGLPSVGGADLMEAVP